MVRRRMGWGRVTSHLLLAYDNEKKSSKNDKRERERVKINVKTKIIKTFFKSSLPLPKLLGGYP